MMKICYAFAVILLIALSAELSAGKRIYGRHRRAVDSDGKPAKESTVVVASDAKSDESAAADLPDDLKSHVEKNDKDCKDFFEMDYNPRRDVFMFNGQMPNLFRPFGPMSGNDSDELGGFPSHHAHGMNNIHRMFQDMFRQASHMFNRFPAMNDTPMINHNFPDNYNGTTEEIVEMDGHKFLKKQHIINKKVNGVQVHLISTTYEEIKDDKTTPDGDSSAGTSPLPTQPGQTDTSAKPTNPDLEKEDIPIKETKAADATTKKPDDLTDGTVVQY